jgi:hypothetical protein
MCELMQLNVGACTDDRAEIRAIRKRNGRPKVGRAAAGRAARAENPRNYCLEIVHIITRPNHEKRTRELLARHRSDAPPFARL